MKRRSALVLSPFLRHVGDLKASLVKFALGPQNYFLFEQEKKKWFGNKTRRDKDEIIRFMDWFCLEFRMTDGSTIVESFVKSAPNLSSEDREILLRWRGVFETILEVKGYEGDGYKCYNWFNDKNYLVKATTDLDHSVFPKGMFIITRLVPVNDFHIFSGSQSGYKDVEREKMIEFARELVNKNFLLAIIDNEERIRRGFELQEKDYNEFVEYFGADELIGMGKEVFQKVREWEKWKIYEKIREDGLTRAQKWEGENGKPYILPEYSLPKWLLNSKDLGAVYDKRNGLSYQVDYGRFIGIFNNSTEKTVRMNRKFLEEWLKSRDISPHLFKHAAEKYPEAFCFVMKTHFKWSRFLLPDDLNQLLMKYKKRLLEEPVYPSIIPLM